MKNNFLIIGITDQTNVITKMSESSDSKILFVETSKPTSEVNETMVDKNALFDEYLDNWKAYKNFLHRWSGGALSDDDVFLKAIKNITIKICSYYPGCDAEDLVHEALIRVTTNCWSEVSSPKAYIVAIIKNLAIRHYRKENLSRRGEMPDEIKYEEKFPERLEMAERTEKLLAQTPRHLWWFIEAVISADDYLTEREIAQITNVSRYKVEKCRKELRHIWKNLNCGSYNYDERTSSAFISGSFSARLTFKGEHKETPKINPLLVEIKKHGITCNLYDHNEANNKDITGLEDRKCCELNSFIDHVNKMESTHSKNFGEVLNNPSLKTFELEKKSTSDCIEGEAFWWDNLDFNASDNEIVKFYEHAEICPYHKEMIEKSDEQFVNQLTSLQSVFEDEDEIWLENSTNQEDAFTDLRLSESKRRTAFVNQNKVLFINSIGVVALMNRTVHILNCKISSEIRKKEIVLLLLDLNSIIKEYGGNLIKQSFIEDVKSTPTLILEVSANLQQIFNIRRKFKMRREITFVKTG